MSRYHRALLLFAFLLLAAAPPPDQDNLRGVTGIEQVPPKPAPNWWPVWLGLGLVGAAGAGFVAWRWARRPASAPVLSADEWALAQLDRIDARNLPASGASEAYHTLVSDVIRQYLEMRFHLHAPRQTTEEFLHSLHDSPHLNEEQQKLLQDFLHRCDVAKFAPTQFSTAECQATGAMARKFIRL